METTERLFQNAPTKAGLSPASDPRWLRAGVRRSSPIDRKVSRSRNRGGVQSKKSLAQPTWQTKKLVLSIMFFSGCLIGILYPKPTTVFFIAHLKQNSWASRRVHPLRKVNQNLGFFQCGGVNSQHTWKCSRKILGKRSWTSSTLQKSNELIPKITPSLEQSYQQLPQGAVWTQRDGV